MDPEHHAAHARLWTDLTRRACPGYVAAPAALLAFTAWQAGNGALANLALDRALAFSDRSRCKHRADLGFHVTCMYATCSRMQSCDGVTGY